MPNLIRWIGAVLLAVTLTACGDEASTDGAGASGEASDRTRAANAAVLERLPFDDTADFDAARRGFIATLEEGEIPGDRGNVAYSMKQFDFLEGEASDTTNPSLWRQSQLNAINGLFEVVDGIYQVRGFDLANMTVVRGDTGWIVIDPLTAVETARAGMALVNRELGARPVVAVIFTHSHADHFAGVRGVIDDDDIASGRVQLIAPEGFFEAAVDENILAGNHMSRRASYMFGNLLPKGPKGSIGSGLGQTTAAGQLSLMRPTDIITQTGETRTIDGVDIVFQNTPGAEAPAEMMFYFPQFKALCQSEEINHTFHNLYTPRGAKVRSGLLWSKYIDEAIRLFGVEAEVSFGSHHWPTWGNARIIDFMEKQRDLYRYVHDETLRLANHGYTMIEIAEMIELPESLATTFANRDYYGTVNHNAKAQYQLYFGWFDGNPANLHALPPAEAGAKYVEFMGGAEAVITKAGEFFDKGDYRWVAMVLNHVVFADPDNADARALLAAAYTQMGYQAESGPWRNFYLTAAGELARGVLDLPAPATGSPDIIKAVSLETLLDYLAVRLNGPKAAGKAYVFNLDLPDVGEKATLRVANGVLNYRLGDQAASPTASIRLDRATLDRINLGAVSFDDAMAAGDVALTGDRAAWGDFLSMLDSFEFWFNIVTP